MSHRSTAKRCGHDEGTFRQRADGRWEVRCYLPNGERVSVYGKSRPEARAKVNEAMTNANKGLSLKADRQPLSEFLAVWLEEVCRPKLALSTSKSYESYLNTHVIPELGHVKSSSASASRRPSNGSSTAAASWA
jgi:integrase